MTAKPVKNLAIATLFFAVCLLSGCAEQPPPPSSNNDDVITPEYSPRDGGEIGGGAGSKICVLAGLIPGALYRISFDVQLPGGGGYILEHTLRADDSGDINVPNVPAEVDCHKFQITLLPTPTRTATAIAGIPPKESSQHPPRLFHSAATPGGHLSGLKSNSLYLVVRAKNFYSEANFLRNFAALSSFKSTGRWAPPKGRAGRKKSDTPSVASPMPARSFFSTRRYFLPRLHTTRRPS